MGIEPTKRVLALILAGGRGERLYPLTVSRPKPSVPFGAKHRIVDFVLSNCINSGVQSIYVLVQYMSQSLIEYLRSSWRTVGLTRDQFIALVPPQMRLGQNWYQGTADAVRQNLNLIYDFDPDIVAVFGSDHIYRMDIGQMIHFHLKREADITVSAIPVPIERSQGFGIIEADGEGKILSFVEKPKIAKPMPTDPTRAYASMGNYLFSTEALLAVLSDKTLGAGAEFDFGKSVLPVIYKKMRTYAYDFALNILPGLKSHEEKAYWRDVGTIESFYQSHMDILGEFPRFDLNNHRWPIHSERHDGPPARILDGRLLNSVIGDGSLIEKSSITNSILGRGVEIEEGAIIEDSIIMDFCRIGKGSRLKRVIVDRFNTVAAQSVIGYDREKDSQLYFVDSSGLVVIPRGKTPGRV